MSKKRLKAANLDGPNAEAVALEIRAAELADLAYSHADHVESSGWFAFSGDFEPPEHLDPKRWHAGWLGRAIREHAKGIR